MMQDMEGLAQRFKEAKEAIPLDIPSQYRDIFAGIIALGLEQTLGTLLAPKAARCYLHYQWPNCEICGEEVKPGLLN